MQIQYRSIDELKPYEKNPRKNKDAVKYVAESIKEFGFQVPVVIDKNNVIVAGHTRYKAAKQLCIMIVSGVHRQEDAQQSEITEEKKNN